MSLIAFLFLSQLVAVGVAAFILRKSLPRRLRREICDNCYRLDNTWSPRRAARERRAVHKFQRRQIWLMVLILLPANGLMLLFHSLIMPVDLAFDVATSVRATDAAWVREMDDRRIEQRHAEWYQQRYGGVPLDAVELQEALWEWSSWLAMMLVLVAAATCYALCRSYLAGLQLLREGVGGRALEYRLYDQDLWYEREFADCA